MLQGTSTVPTPIIGKISRSAISKARRGAWATRNIQSLGLTESIAGRDVIIVEDIVDTGLTMHKMLETLAESEPASLEIASLFVKPARLRVPLDVKYSAFEIPDRFIVGYGLDYDGLGRNLPDVYDVVE